MFLARIVYLFFEQRVYEHEAVVEGAVEVVKQKTKEEKEAELFNKMTEACLAGMSIMDTYFDKLNAKDIKRNDNLGGDYEEEEEEEAITGNENPDDLVIYEAKDPYVLRSLPYLIGSQAFLDNDHVGLKDLDSDDEELLEEDLDETDLDESGDDESVAEDEKKPSVGGDVFDNSTDEDEAGGSEVEETVKKKSGKVVFSGSDDSNESDVEGLFGSGRKVGWNRIN